MEAPNPRRLLQFSIKSLLLFTLLAATFSMGWVAHRKFARNKEAEERAQRMAETKRLNAEVMGMLDKVHVQIRESQADFARTFEKRGKRSLKK